MTIEREWVSLESATASRAGHGSNPCQGLYHRPSGTHPSTAFVATHYNVDFSEHYLAEHLVARGYGFLGWNTRFRGHEAYFILESALVDIGAGVRWLREAGVETIVLLGNSGGGSLMSAYQSQATEPTIAPVHGGRLPEAVLDLPGADAYISLNAHPGRPEVLTNWCDASVVDETDPLSRDAELDLYADGREIPYDPAFLERFRAGQRNRNHRITAWVHAELARMEAHGAGADRLFTVHRVFADPRFLDLSIDPSDRRPGCYAGDPRRANDGPLGIGRTSTLRSWLSMWALSESQCSGSQHLPRVTVPSLVVQSMGDRGVYPSDARAIHAAIGAEDKCLEFLPGEHYFEDGGRDGVADLIIGWLQDRSV